MKIFLSGAAGRMGQAITLLLDGDKQVALTNEVVAADVIIDFSAPAGTLKILETAIAHQKPVVIGTTGFTEQALDVINRSAELIPIVFEYNMSIGVCVLRHLVRRAADLLPDFDVELFEAHHKQKKDSPSGTALALIDDVCESKNASKSALMTFRQQGLIGNRKPDEIGVQVLRGGNIVGEHTVYFCGHSERIEITHRALNREIFARGAIKAAQFLFKQVNQGGAPRLYRMKDVLGIDNR